MPDLTSSLTAIGLMALLVYSTRIGGYLVGLRIRHIGRLRPVLEALPGCAMMAILTPAVRNGSTLDWFALACVILVMWKTESVVLATVLGLGLLLFGADIYATIFL